MEDVMDLENAKKVVALLREKKIIVKEIETLTPSPFAIGLFVQGIAEVMKMEERLAFVKRMHERVIEKIKNKKGYEESE